MKKSRYTKQEMINRIAGETGLSKLTVQQVLDAKAHTAQEVLSLDVDVILPGIGVLSAKRRPAHERTGLGGERVKVPEKVEAKFRPAGALNDALARRLGGGTV